MRIAIITPGFSAQADDWAIPALLNLTRALAQAGHHLHIFSQRYPAEGEYAFDGLSHHALGGGQHFGLTSTKIWLQTSQMIIRHHRHTPFDVLHAFWADEAGFSAVLAGWKLKRPVIVSLGGGELTHLPDIQYGAQRFLARRLTTRLALKKAALVTAGSPYQLDLCRAHAVPEGKLRLAPLGVDTELFQPLHLNASTPPKSSIQNPTLIQAASLLPVKNQPLLFEVLRLVKTEFPQIKLHLAGTGPLQQELAQRVQALDLQANVVWRQPTYPEMPPLYQASQLYLQTSRHESQGLAVLEAMACGLPVVGTPVGVAREVACLPPQRSAEALAAQVIQLFSDASAYQARRQQAYETVQAAYALPLTVDNFVRLYGEALSGSTTP